MVINIELARATSPVRTVSLMCLPRLAVRALLASSVFFGTSVFTLVIRTGIRRSTMPGCRRSHAKARFFSGHKTARHLEFEVNAHFSNGVIVAESGLIRRTMLDSVGKGETECPRLAEDEGRIHQVGLARVDPVAAVFDVRHKFVDAYEVLFVVGQHHGERDLLRR